MSDTASSLLGTAPTDTTTQPASPPTDGPASPSAPVQHPDTPATPAGETPWSWDKYTKDEDLGWVQTKGYKTPQDLIKAARSSEQLIGLEKLPIPKDEKDAEGWNRVYKRLGMPEKPEDYKLELPEGTDKTFVDRMAKMMHANGVSQKAAASLAKEYMAFGTEQQTRQQAEQQSQYTRDLDALKVQWGQATEKEVSVAQQGIDAFCGEGQLEKMKAALGPAETLRFFNKLGNELREAKRVDGDGGGFGPMTPAQAKYQISQKQLDSNFMAAYMDRNHPGHATALAEMTKLHRYASPE
jgi:hypothetical protein